jgi:hypothetical protein
VFMSGGDGKSSDSSGLGGLGAGQGVFGLLLNLLVAEKSGFSPVDDSSTASLQEFADRMTREALDSMPNAGEIEVRNPAASEPPVANGLRSS